LDLWWIDPYFDVVIAQFIPGGALPAGDITEYNEE
jgi:hypothetical protein